MSFQHNFPIILERFAMNYPRQARFGYELMPLFEADIAKENYNAAQLDGDHLKTEDFKRAYGAQAKRSNQQVQSWKTINVHRYTIESSVDRAELIGSNNEAQSSLFMREARMRSAYDKLMNSIEVEQVASILDQTKYGSHTSTPKAEQLWSHADSDPLAQIELAKQKIKQSIGFYPNKCVISDTVWQVLRFKTNLLDKLPSSRLKAGLTPEDFADIIDVDKVTIADNMHHKNNQLEYTWGDSVVLAYVPETLYSLEQLSFGVTVRAPLGYDTMRNYFDEKTTSDVTAIDERLGWSVTNYKAGYLFKNVL